MLVLALVVVACRSEAPAPDSGPPAGRSLRIPVPPGPDVGLGPGTQQMLRVQYLDAAGGGIAKAQVRFAIFEDPRGSTLSSDAANTDAEGFASIQLRAGATSSRFQVHASAPGAKDAVFYVEVSDAGFGALAISAEYNGALGGAQLTDLKRVTYSLYGEVACTSVDPLSPPTPLRTRLATGLDKEVVLGALPLNLAHTVTARVDRTVGTGWQPRAWGCVEIPVGALKADEQLSMTLSVADLWPSLVGSYTLTSSFTLPKLNRPLADALQPWTDLVDCPTDPGQLMLDCILDALDPGDPLDCKVVQPSAKTQALMAERGTLEGVCRTNTSAKGTPSLEKLVADLAQSWGGGTKAALAKVETQGADALSDLELQSQLVVQTLAQQDVGTGTVVTKHALERVTFPGPGGSAAVYNVADVGLAKWVAFPVQATVTSQGPTGWGWDLALQPHTFSLSFGLLARDALGKLVLSPLGLPGTSAALASHLANEVTGTPKAGCAAIDAVACKAARLGPGCLAKACTTGLAGLASYLDAGFDQIDGQHTDLTLEGSAELKDTDGDLRVDGLGDVSAPGTWKASFAMGGESIVPLDATFFGKP